MYRLFHIFSRVNIANLKVKHSLRHLNRIIIVYGFDRRIYRFLCKFKRNNYQKPVNIQLKNCKSKLVKNTH